MRAISVHGFAGGFDLGIVSAGGELIGRRQGADDFGGPLVEGNRALLGNGWETQAVDPTTWDVDSADLVFGNPACSGFSALSVYQRAPDGEWRDGRGQASHLNQGMYDLIDYAGRVAPPVVAFESVAAAGRKGRALMLRLRDRLEVATGLKYDLTHVYQDCASVGGYALRRRYHFVAHRVPLGLDFPVYDHEPSLRDAIGDLETLGLGRGANFMDGHVTKDSRIADDVKRIAHEAEHAGQPWLEREKVGLVVCRLARGDEMLTKIGPGRVPYQIPARCFACNDLWTLMEAEGLVKGEIGAAHPKAGLDMSWVRNIHWKTNLYAAIRWAYDKPAATVTGGFLEDAVHPVLNRTMTYREEARIMGFPDDWTVLPAVDDRLGALWMGKGIPVQAGRWIGAGIMRSLAGDPGPLTGSPIGDREWIIDTTGSWKHPRKPEQMELFG